MTWRAPIIGSRSQLLGAFRELRRVGEDPPMQEIGDLLVTSTRLRIDQGVSPDGKPFAPVLRGGKPLRDTSTHIYGPLHARATRDAVLVGVPYAWARVHQNGATIRAQNAPWLRFLIRGKGWVTKKQVTIPARPFLGVSSADASGIVGVLRRRVERAKAGA